MKILLEEITESGISCELEDQSWFPSEEIKQLGLVCAGVFLERKGNRVLVNGEIRSTIEFDCDRCLEAYKHKLVTHFKIVAEYEPIDESHIFDKDHACLESEMDIIQLDKPEIDLSSLLRQQLYLAIPAKKLCCDTCPGLCANCGMSLKNKQCNCSGLDTSSPFGILAKLKDSQ